MGGAVGRQPALDPTNPSRGSVEPAAADEEEAEQDRQGGRRQHRPEGARAGARHPVAVRATGGPARGVGRRVRGPVTAGGGRGGPRRRAAGRVLGGLVRRRVLGGHLRRLLGGFVRRRLLRRVLGGLLRRVVGRLLRGVLGRVLGWALGSVVGRGV